MYFVVCNRTGASVSALLASAFSLYSPLMNTKACPAVVLSDAASGLYIWYVPSLKRDNVFLAIFTDAQCLEADMKYYQGLLEQRFSVDPDTVKLRDKEYSAAMVFTARARLRSGVDLGCGEN